MGKTNILKRTRALFWLRLALFIIVGVSLFVPVFSDAADDTVCAEVKIEIKQELTLERQAFDAHMRINNGLSHITLQDVDVDVSFTDAEGNSVLASSDPDNTDAIFYIRIDSMENIDDVDGSGTIDPSSAADIHWLIIPAPGASKGLEQGTLYYVGATLTYVIGGEENVTRVAPDYIFVKPMPELILDYFLTTNVYGDDAFTLKIEPPVPFSLGLRVSNTGAGTAKDLKIDAAQPKIVENEQGLLIGFVIEESQVNGRPAEKSLLVDLGDIASNAAATARWIMTCTLSGQFVDFYAGFSHSDELGGELTSLIRQEDIHTHFLVQDVLADLPGRDTVSDFLAKDGDVYRIYESDSTDTAVADQSASSSLQLESQHGALVHYTLAAPVTTGFMYVKLPDPYNGEKVLVEAVRSDGKLIKNENTWLSKTRNGQSWVYFINLFDANTTESYTVKFGESSALPQAPELQSIGDWTGVEGQQLSFTIQANDPNGTIPALSATPLPAGSDFSDQGDGSGIFNWTPAEGQAGTYEITFTASDGVLKDSARAILSISSIGDTDADGMPDAWEMQHFGTLDRDGSGDFDGDGISDLNEYLNGTNPSASNAPSVPVIVSPAVNTEVTALQPNLVIGNSTDSDGDAVSYAFEVYSDEAMANLIAAQEGVTETSVTTSWTVSTQLVDNTWYYWRVRATDGKGYSPWVYGSFFVNTANDPPGAFAVSSPQDTTEVDTRTPELEVTNSSDVDQDVIAYSFEVYAESEMNTLIASVSGIAEETGGTTSWTVGTVLDDNTWYYWRAIAEDEHGATAQSPQTPPASFFVNTINDAPSAPQIVSPADGSEIASQELDLTISNALDLDGDLLVYYFEIDRVNTFDSGALQTSGEISEGQDTTGWHIAGLDDNSNYFWRAQASDGFADSPWSPGSFFVNTANDSPTVPVLKNPGDQAWGDTLTPTLELNAATDPDNDSLIYRFELYTDAALTVQAAAGESDMPEWVVSPQLTDNTWYYWRAQAEDEHGADGGWMNTASFFTDSNGVNDPPAIAMQTPAGDLFTNGNSFLITWQDSDPDSNAQIALYYDADNAGQDGTLIVEGLQEDPDGANDAYAWDISGLEGTYYIYGIVTDSISSQTSYSSGSVTIDRTPPFVSASPAGGTFDTAQSVTLVADETTHIYYTLDGSDPTTASILYNIPVEIPETVTLKFMAVDSAGNQSAIISELYTINIVSNVPPVADAGADLDVPLGDTAYPDGSASHDPDSGPESLTFSWSFVSVPAESALTDTDIIDADTSGPSFTPDAAGTYVLELTVDDGAAAASDQISIICSGGGVYGDLDGDGDVDRDDVYVILGYRNQPASVCPECDIDGDGTITIGDGRSLMYYCTCPNCICN